MRIVYGVSCISSSLLLFCITLLGSRNPKQPRWASDFLIANVYSISIIALGIYGLGLLIQHASQPSSEAVGPRELVLSGAVALLTLVGIKVLRVRRRLAAYRAHGPGGNLVALPGRSAPEADEPPKPPSKPKKRRLAA